MTTSPTQTHDARHANRRLLVEQIRNDGLDAVLARMTGEEFKEFKVFVVAALLGKLDNQSTSPNVEAPRAWNDVSSVQTEELRSSIIEECAKAINKRMQALCSDPAVCWQEPDTGATIIGSRFSDHIEALDEAEAIVRALKTIPSPRGA